MPLHSVNVNFNYITNEKRSDYSTFSRQVDGKFEGDLIKNEITVF